MFYNDSCSEKSNKKKKKVKNENSSMRLSASRLNWSGSSSSVTSDCDNHPPDVTTVVTKFHDMMKLKVIDVFLYLDFSFHL